MKKEFIKMLDIKRIKIISKMAGSVDGKEFSGVLLAVDQWEEYKRGKALFNTMVDDLYNIKIEYKQRAGSKPKDNDKDKPEDKAKAKKEGES